MNKRDDVGSDSDSKRGLSARRGDNASIGEVIYHRPTLYTKQEYWASETKKAQSSKSK